MKKGATTTIELQSVQCYGGREILKINKLEEILHCWTTRQCRISIHSLNLNTSKIHCVHRLITLMINYFQLILNLLTWSAFSFQTLFFVTPLLDFTALHNKILPILSLEALQVYPKLRYLEMSCIFQFLIIIMILRLSFFHLFLISKEHGHHVSTGTGHSFLVNA